MAAVYFEATVRSLPAKMVHHHDVSQTRQPARGPVIESRTLRIPRKESQSFDTHIRVQNPCLLNNNSTEQKSFLGSWQSLTQSRNSSYFTELKGSLPRLQNLVFSSSYDIIYIRPVHTKTVEDTFQYQSFICAPDLTRFHVCRERKSGVERIKHITCHQKAGRNYNMNSPVGNEIFRLVSKCKNTISQKG